MAWSDIRVSLVGFSGSTVTLAAANPQSRPETARVGVTVILSDGSSSALRSATLTLAPGETRTVDLTASSSISSVSDSPEPFPPA